MTNYKYKTVSLNKWQYQIAQKITESNPVGFFEFLDAVALLRRIAAGLHRIAENDCNGHPKIVIEYREGKKFEYNTENIEWKIRDEKREMRLLKQAEEIATKYQWKIETQGDPRGAVLKIASKSGQDFTDLLYK